MGIQGLTKLIADNAPQAIKENQINNYFGRKIAVDASMTLYQFLIAVRPDDTNSFTLTNESGETTRCENVPGTPLLFSSNSGRHFLPVTSWVSSTARFV